VSNANKGPRYLQPEKRPGTTRGSHNSSRAPGRRFFIESLKAVFNSHDCLTEDDCRRLGCQCNRSRVRPIGGAVEDIFLSEAFAKVGDARDYRCQIGSRSVRSRLIPHSCSGRILGERELEL
jgi:hypothetical protein